MHPNEPPRLQLANLPTPLVEITSKAMTGLLATLRRGAARAGATPVFIHTGGVFGLMARRDLFP